MIIQKNMNNLNQERLNKMKIYLIKVNQYLNILNNIFPNMIKNCYVEFYVFENYTKQMIEYNFNRTLNSIYSGDDSIDVTDCTNLILELISGDLISFNATTDGVSIYKYDTKYEMIESIHDIVDK